MWVTLGLQCIPSFVFGELNLTSPHGELSVEVHSANPWAQAFDPMQEAIKRHTGDIRMAFAYVRMPAVKLLEPIAERMKNERSFLIASPDEATSQKALEKLDGLAEDFVYIHRGVQGCSEKPGRGYRPVMHSKVALSLDDDRATAWLGSHNLTAFALNGFNAEIAVCMSGPRDHPALAAIEEHLDNLLQDAEPWCPGQGGIGIPNDNSKVLVLDAFGCEGLLKEGCHMHLPLPKEIDQCVPEDKTNFSTKVHIYVYRSESDLRKEVNPTKAVEQWTGTLSGLNKTEVPAAWKENEFLVYWDDEDKDCPPEIRKSLEPVTVEDELKQFMVEITVSLPTQKEAIPIHYSTDGQLKVYVPETGFHPRKTEIEVDFPDALNDYIKWDSLAESEISADDQEYIHFAGKPKKGRLNIEGLDDPKEKQESLEKYVPDGFELNYKYKKPDTTRERYLYFSPKQWYPLPGQPEFVREWTPDDDNKPRQGTFGFE